MPARRTFFQREDENRVHVVPSACIWDRSGYKSRAVVCAKGVGRRLLLWSSRVGNVQLNKGQQGVAGPTLRRPHLIRAPHLCVTTE